MRNDECPLTASVPSDGSGVRVMRVVLMRAQLIVDVNPVWEARR